MKTVLNSLFTLSLIVFGFNTVTHAQWGDPMNMSYDQWTMQLSQYDQQMNQYMDQQMQAAQHDVDQAYANIQKFFIDYYRQNTGDYSTPDHQALQLGDRLYCQHYPVKCQQNIQHANQMSQISADGHQQRMNDIASWGDTMNQVALSDSSILDMSHNGYMDRSAMQSEGQAGLVQGSIQGESTFVNPNGISMSLPVYPDPQWSYQTADGYPLDFDYNKNTWYQGDGYGGWVQLQSY